VLFDITASVYFICKYIYILVLEMASPGNQHCANCIGTLSFPILRQPEVHREIEFGESVHVRRSFQIHFISDHFRSGDAAVTRIAV